MIVPEGHRIVVEIPELEKQTKGGIYKPQEALEQEKYAQVMGKIVLKGETAGNCFKDGISKNVGMIANVGDTIVFTKYAGVVVTDPDDEEEYRIINDEDVMAVIK